MSELIYQAPVSDLMLSTAEAADLLGVHPSTAKRWLDEPRWTVTRTEGGHRRVAFQDVMALAADRVGPTPLAPFQPYESHVWSVVQAAEKGDASALVSLAVGWLLYGDPTLIPLLFELLIDRGRLSFETVIDRPLRNFMAAVGEGWRKGSIGIADEHLATHLLLQSLFHLRRLSARPRSSAPKTAIVASAEGNAHQLAALAVCVTLDTRGWRTWFLGSDVSPAEVGGAVVRRDAELVCVSFSETQLAPELTRFLDGLKRHTVGLAPFDVAVGGGPSEELGPVTATGSFRSVRPFPSLIDLAGWLDRGEEGTHGG